MKVLKNNYNETNIKEIKKEVPPYPRKLICNECGSELEYEESDLRMGEYGAIFIDCPLCGEDNILEGNEHSITLTKDNVEFPIHFHHTSKETGAVDICTNENVQKEIKKAIEYFRKNKDEEYWFTESGNLYIEIQRDFYSEDYWVIVTNDFYETYIPFESEDYDKSF